MMRRPVAKDPQEHDIEDNHEKDPKNVAGSSDNWLQSFIQRKVVQPVKAVFTQGITPDSLALSIAFGN